MMMIVECCCVVDAKFCFSRLSFKATLVPSFIFFLLLLLLLLLSREVFFNFKYFMIY